MNAGILNSLVSVMDDRHEFNESASDDLEGVVGNESEADAPETESIDEWQESDPESSSDEESEGLEPEHGESEDGDSEEEPAEEVTGPRLVLRRNGIDTEHVFPIHSPAIIGRFDPSVGPIDVDLGTIDEGVYVSRKHAKITEEDGVFRIEDMGSSNGTFVLRSDFERVQEAELESGTEIAFGNARFVFYT